jgi:hypothetical protein
MNLFLFYFIWQQKHHNLKKKKKRDDTVTFTSKHNCIEYHCICMEDKTLNIFVNEKNHV